VRGPVRIASGSGTATLGLAGTSTGDNEFNPQLVNANFAVTKSGAGLSPSV